MKRQRPFAVRPLLAALLCLALAACRIEIEVPTSGEVRTASGSISCATGETCSLPVVDLFFDETFSAVAAEGFVFAGWERKDRSLCGGSAEPCHLATESFEGNEILMRILEDPQQVFYLDPVFQSEGFNSLFIGHSFFRPFAEGMPALAEQAGIERHEQAIVFSGGANGAPEALWNNASKRADIQAVLDGGDIELFAMTYHPDYPTLTGYRNWIDYALERNPDTRIALALPWLTQPHTYESDEYEALWKDFNVSTFQAGADRLRQLYPETEIFIIPYGQAAVELRKLLAAGELPEVEVVTSRTQPAIFRDDLGHANQMLVDLGRLVWLRSIYGIDLDTIPAPEGYETDLNSLAQAIADEQDPRYDAPYR